MQRLIYFFFPITLLCASLPTAISKLAAWDETLQVVLWLVPIACMGTEDICRSMQSCWLFWQPDRVSCSPLLTFRFNNFSLLLFLLYNYNALLFILTVIPSPSPTRPNGLSWGGLPRVWACVLDKSLLHWAVPGAGWRCGLQTPSTPPGAWGTHHSTPGTTGPTWVTRL